MADLGIDAQLIGSLKIFKRHKCASLIIRFATLHYKDSGLSNPKLMPLTGEFGTRWERHRQHCEWEYQISGSTDRVSSILAGRLFHLSQRYSMFPLRVLIYFSRSFSCLSANFINTRSWRSAVKYIIWLISFERGLTPRLQNLFEDEMVAIVEIDN